MESTPLPSPKPSTPKAPRHNRRRVVLWVVLFLILVIGVPIAQPKRFVRFLAPNAKRTTTPSGWALSSPAADWSFEPQVFAVGRDGSSLMATRAPSGLSLDPDNPHHVTPMHGSQGVVIARYSASGALDWSRGIGAPYGQLKPLRAVLADDGRAYLAGIFCGAIDFDPGKGVTRLLGPPVVKGASTAGLFDSPAFASDMATMAQPYDLFLLSLTPAGDFAWVDSWRLGGPVSEALALALDPHGRPTLLLYAGGATDVDPGPAELRQGALQSDEASSAYLVRLTLDAAGQLQDMLHWGPMSFAPDAPLSLHYDRFGNAYLSGVLHEACDMDPSTGVTPVDPQTAGGFYLLSLDDAGYLRWIDTWAFSTHEGIEVAVNPDGQTAIALDLYTGPCDADPGPGVRMIGQGPSDNLVVTLTLKPDGSLEWLRAHPPRSVAWINDVTIDSAGAVAVTGSYRGTVDFDAGLAELNRTAIGYLPGHPGGGSHLLYGWPSDSFLIKFTPTGGIDWLATWGGADHDAAYVVGADAADGLHVFGQFAGSADLDPGSGTSRHRTGSRLRGAYLLNIAPGATL